MLIRLDCSIMPNRTMHGLLAAALLLLASAGALPARVQEDARAQEDDRPNVVIFMVDDMGYSDIPGYGGEIPMPNLDALAEDGLRFSRFYNTPRCSPTRASLLTGQHPHRVGLGLLMNTPQDPRRHDRGVAGHRGFLSRRGATIAEVLCHAGYHTYMTGKWHLGYHAESRWPLQRGFERFYGIIAGNGLPAALALWRSDLRTASDLV